MVTHYPTPHPPIQQISIHNNRNHQLHLDLDLTSSLVFKPFSQNVPSLRIQASSRAFSFSHSEHRHLGPGSWLARASFSWVVSMQSSRVKSKVALSLPVSFGQPALKCFERPVAFEFSELQCDLQLLHLLFWL